MADRRNERAADEIEQRLVEIERRLPMTDLFSDRASSNARACVTIGARGLLPCAGRGECLVSDDEDWKPNFRFLTRFIEQCQRDSLNLAKKKQKLGAIFSKT